MKTVLNSIARLSAIAAASVAPIAMADAPESGPTISQVAGNVHVIHGKGGNIGVIEGSDGVFMIDDQYAPASAAILSLIKGISDQPLKFVLNTHWHPDHTGGNENMAKEGALIVAHDNVRQRMTKYQEVAAFNMKVQPSPAIALPKLTFNDTATFHINGLTVHGFHVKNAHTDGDTIIRIPELNVVHMGDTYFSGMYPFIDAGTGGTVPGVMAAMDLVLAMSDDDVKIIPGHGAVSTKAQLAASRVMLEGLYNNVLALKDKSREEVIAAKPAADYDTQWGQGFLNSDVFVGIVYDTIHAK